MSGIRAGRLRDKVSIYGERTKDSYGQRTGARTLLKTRRCSIEPINGKEYFAGDGEHGEQRVRVRFRYEAGLLVRGYELIDSRASPAVTYDIQDIIDPGNEHRELIAVCVVRQ